jgi:hypothetical protein
MTMTCSDLPLAPASEAGAEDPPPPPSDARLVGLEGPLLAGGLVVGLRDRGGEGGAGEAKRRGGGGGEAARGGVGVGAGPPSSPARANSASSALLGCAHSLFSRSARPCCDDFCDHTSPHRR